MKSRAPAGLFAVLALPVWLLASAACSDADNPAAPGTGVATEVPSNAQAVTFGIVQEVTTEISGIAERRRSVITGQAAWDGLWDEITTFVMPKPDAPAIDFDSRMVILATMGERTSGGYSISVLEAAQENGTLYVVVEEATPGVQCATTDVVTSPAVAVSVPRSSGTVLFVEREVAYPCAPM